MSDPLRVLLLNERDPNHPKAGGAEVHVAEIARRLARRNIQTTQLAVGFPGGATREQQDGLAVRRLGPIPIYYPRAVALAAWATRRGDYDVVVEHLCKVPFCAAAYASRPVVAVNHHLFGDSAFLQVAWPIAATVVAIEKLIPRIYRKVPFLAVSESSRDDLVERGLAREQIDLLYNGINFPERHPMPVAQRPCRVAYLGRLETYKRIDTLLRACARLRQRFPALELVLVGRGSERETLEALGRELGIADCLRFTGFVSDEERDALLAETRVAVCPSVKEGWGLTVIECNALGVPVVATDAPGLRDAVRHGETGLLVPDAAPEAFVAGLAEAIGGLLEDEVQLEQLSTEAHRWAARFDWDRSAEVMEETLRRVARTA